MFAQLLQLFDELLQKILSYYYIKKWAQGRVGIKYSSILSAIIRNVWLWFQFHQEEQQPILWEVGTVTLNIKSPIALGGSQWTYLKDPTENPIILVSPILEGCTEQFPLSSKCKVN